MDAETQARIEAERAVEGRCPRCGSPRNRAGEYVYDEDTDMDYGIGVQCYDCHYWHNGEQVINWRPFVEPGASGSYDFPRDAIAVKED